MQDHVSGFLARLGTIKGEIRKVSDPRDYVLAVWTDCPLYKIPVGYGDMDVVALMHDALTQLERDCGVSLPVLAPAGVFDGNLRSRTGLFEPSVCLDHSRLTDSSKVYTMICDNMDWTNLPQPWDGHQGLRLEQGSHKFSLSLSSSASDFQDHIILAESQSMLALEDSFSDEDKPPNHRRISTITSSILGSSPGFWLYSKVGPTRSVGMVCTCCSLFAAISL